MLRLLFAGMMVLMWGRCHGGSWTSGYLEPSDNAHLKSVLDTAWSSDDLSSIHYAVKGYTILGLKPPKPTELCKTVVDKLDAKSVESLYHAIGVAKELGNCNLKLNVEEAAAALNAVIATTSAENLTTQRIFYATVTLKNIGKQVDPSKVTSALLAVIKKNDSVLSLGYAFRAASLLPGDLTQFIDRFEDVVVQADEVDEKYLHFEGGLSSSSVIIGGIHELASHAKKPLPYDAEKSVKFTNYFLSRKGVPVIRGAYHLLDVLDILRNNKQHTIVAVTLHSGLALTKETPDIQVKVTDLFGNGLPTAVNVVLDGAKAVGSGAVSVSNLPFQAVPGDSTLYKLNFLQSKVTSGFYELTVSANPAQKNLNFAGNAGAKFQVKVMRQVALDGVEIGVVDADQAVAPRLTTVEFSKKLGKELEADYHQKLQLRFVLKDKVAGTAITAHQVFVRLSNEETKQEMIFVAEEDNSKTYKFEMDVHSRAADFGSISGKYTIALIVGDALLSNPFEWVIGDVDIAFQDGKTGLESSRADYLPKEEINHIFRESEKRPPSIVASTFTILSILPLLLLIIMWSRIGANMSNLTLSVSTVGFHLGFAGILGLFALFWIQLNMFSTLKYLAILVIFTMLSGNSMLSRIAATQKS